jgi:hypothetical protein
MRTLHADWLQYLIKAVIVCLPLAALVDSYALARAYVARNSDMVTVVATKYNHVVGVPPILGVTTVRYTGATARKIELAIDTYPYLKPDLNVGLKNCNYGASDHSYRYQMTFTLAGIVTEVATTTTGGCVWERSILGRSEEATWTDGANPLFAIEAITNGTFPT